MFFLKMTTEMAIREILTIVKSAQNRKSVRLNKEKEKLKIENLIAA